MRHRLKQSRAFIFSLIAISAIWLVSSMSEQKVYREHYRLSLDGIDRAKYAVKSIDSVLTLDITSNGFYALRRGLRKNCVIHINIGETIAKDKTEEIKVRISTNDYIDAIRNQIDSRGVASIKAVTEEIEAELSERCEKAFVPSIDKVNFQFAAMIGLYGEPVMIPDTVWLYGSKESLEKIDAIGAEPQTIKEIRSSMRHRVKLDGSWKKYGDVYPSTETIDIFVPVEKYIEKTISVPVVYETPSQYKRVQLYPSSVKLTCLVAEREYDEIDENSFTVTVRDISDTLKHLQPTVTEFPSNVRVKAITPSQIQYIIIK